VSCILLFVDVGGNLWDDDEPYEAGGDSSADRVIARSSQSADSESDGPLIKQFQYRRDNLVPDTQLDSTLVHDVRLGPGIRREGPDNAVSRDGSNKRVRIEPEEPLHAVDRPPDIGVQFEGQQEADIMPPRHNEFKNKNSRPTGRPSLQVTLQTVTEKMQEGIIRASTDNTRILAGALKGNQEAYEASANQRQQELFRLQQEADQRRREWALEDEKRHHKEEKRRRKQERRERMQYMEMFSKLQEGVLKTVGSLISKSDK
jgi:hypothetical protein